MGRGTAIAVAGVSLCLMGVILGQLGGWGLFMGLVFGFFGVAVSFVGVADEHESARMQGPPKVVGP